MTTMIRKIAGALLALTFAAAAGAARAEPTMAEYTASSGSERQVLSLYLFAQDAAYGWANTVLDDRKQPRLYCMARNEAHTSEQVTALVDGFAAKHSNVDLSKYNLGLILLTALQETYPCPAK